MDIAPAYPSAPLIKAEFLAWSFGELDQALRNFGYAVELDPQSAIAYFGIARVFSQLGDKARAVDNIERCLELGPNFLWGQSAAAEIYQIFGDKERALQHARRALAIKPGGTTSLRLLRDWDIDSERAADARARYETFFPELADRQQFEVTRKNYKVAIDYAYLLYAAGADEELRDILLPVLDFLPTVSRLGLRGRNIADVRVLAMLGEPDKALDTLEAAVAEGWRRNWRLLLELPSLDSIRDDPRFTAQSEILEADMAAQLESYLASQASGR
jgi:tetratricopeptide (TPR) repeat protein